MTICLICQERPANLILCKTCGRHYTKHVSERAIYDVIIWAAKRTRAYERKHVKEAKKASQ